MLFHILALILGILAGTITGLSPGIHINLITIIILSFSSLILKFNPTIIIIFIIAMAITHTFVDFIPSIFLGAPDEDTILSILPGHEFLIKGKAYEAIILTLFGSLSAIFIIILLSPIIISFLPKIYPYIQTIMPFILILASIFLLYSERNSRFWAVFIFLLAGLLGIACLNLPINQPLLPLLTGLFGSSSLITAIIKKQKIPKQKIIKIKQIKKQIPNKSIFKALLASIIASPLCSFLPGLGSGQAAIIGSGFVKDLNRKEFLILLGSINTIVMGLSFITFYSIQKTRTGAAVAINQIISQPTTQNLYIILTTILITGIISVFITIFLAKIFSKKISKINYTYLSYLILIILSGIITIFSGKIGIIIFITSTLLGLTCILLGIKRTHLMGCLLIPTILFYLLI